ncbi:Carotenoid oxygenase, partial [Trinorchestia longiramus]
MKQVRKKFVVKPLFLLHVANCYEDAGGNVVVDFPSYSDVSLLHKLYIDKLRQSLKGAQHEEFRSSFYSSVTRIVLPVAESDTRTEVPVKVMPLSATAALENPVINPVYGRRKHRYIYGMGVSSEGGDRGQ